MPYDPSDPTDIPPHMEDRPRTEQRACVDAFNETWDRLSDAPQDEREAEAMIACNVAAKGVRETGAWAAIGARLVVAVRYSHIDFSPTAGVKEEMRRGLAWHEEGHSGDGIQADTVAWATRIVGGADWSPEKAREADGWFPRHEGDLDAKGAKPGDDGFPSPGRVAWALWGGDAGRAQVGKLVRQMDAADREG